MTGMLCLTTNDEPTYYYSSYNGKNMGGIRIPKAVMNKKRVKAHTPTQSAKSTGTKPYVSLVELGIPTDLNLFKQSALHSSDGLFDSIAWTTLDEVRNQFFNIKNNKPYTKEELTNIAKNSNSIKELGYSDINSFRKRCINSGNYYGFDGDKLFTNITKHIPKQFLWTIENVKNHFKNNNYKTKAEFKKSAAGAKAIKYEIFDELTKNLPNGGIRIKWTDSSLLDAARNSKNFIDMVSTIEGKRAYDRIRSSKDKKFQSKCFSHWVNYKSGKKVDWSKK
jgi:hypothetical protein